MHIHSHLHIHIHIHTYIPTYVCTYESMYMYTYMLFTFFEIQTHIHMYIYIHLHTYMYTHVCVYIYIYTSICVYLNIYKHTWIHMYIHMYIHVNIYIHIIYIHYIPIFTYIYIYTCIYIYTYLITHTYTYIDVYIYIYAYLYLHMDTYIYIHMGIDSFHLKYIHTYTHNLYIYIFKYIHIYTCICMLWHTYSHIRPHTHTHWWCHYNADAPVHMALYSKHNYASTHIATWVQTGSWFQALACSSGLSVYTVLPKDRFWEVRHPWSIPDFSKMEGLTTLLVIRGMLQRYVQEYLRQQEIAFRQRCIKALKTWVKGLVEVEGMRVVSSHRIGFWGLTENITRTHTSIHPCIWIAKPWFAVGIMIKPWSHVGSPTIRHFESRNSPLRRSRCRFYLWRL